MKKLKTLATPDGNTYAIPDKVTLDGNTLKFWKTFDPPETEDTFLYSVDLSSLNADKMQQIEQNTQGISELKGDLENVNNNVFNVKQTVINVSYDSNTFPDTSNGVLTTNVNYSSGSIQVEEGEKYHIEGWSFYEVALYGLLDSSGNLIDRYPKVAESTKEHSVDIQIPSGCSTLMIGKRSSIQATTYIPTVIKISYDSRIEKLENESIPLKSSLDALDISYSNFGQKSSACITLIDDDGYPEHIPTIKNICDNLGIKCTFAVNTGKWTNNDVISLLQNYQNEGFHITSHSHNHNNKWGWNQSTTEDDKRILYEDMLKSYQLLEQNGFLDFRMFVTPNGGFDPIVREIVRSWSDCLVTTQEGINVNFKNLFVLKRTFINKTTGNHDLQYYKGMIDSTISTGGWLIFGTHSGDVEWNGNDFDSELVTNVLQYAKDKNVEILPLNSAYKKRKRYYDLYNLFGN